MEAIQYFRAEQQSSRVREFPKGLLQLEMTGRCSILPHRERLLPLVQTDDCLELADDLIEHRQYGLPLGDQNLSQPVVNNAFKALLVTLIARKTSPTPNFLLTASRTTDRKSGEGYIE